MKNAEQELEEQQMKSQQEMGMEEAERGEKIHHFHSVGYKENIKSILKLIYK